MESKIIAQMGYDKASLKHCYAYEKLGAIFICNADKRLASVIRQSENKNILEK